MYIAQDKGKDFDQRKKINKKYKKVDKKVEKLTHSDILVPVRVYKKKLRRIK